MNNLDIYNASRAVPPEAQKPIVGGRLKGKTDINPVWRIKALTEQFGVCGIGWYTEITKQWTETGANGEISAFVNINLYIKYEGEWSRPIPGTGGSTFVAKESNGLYTSDECYKMAYTDAISVACKALGFGADVYWNADKTKYDKPQDNKPASKGTPEPQKPAQTDSPEKAAKEQIAEVFNAANTKFSDQGKPENYVFTFLEKMETDMRITTRYPYADKTKTKINWTAQDITTLMDDLELPF